MGNLGRRRASPRGSPSRLATPSVVETTLHQETDLTMGARRRKPARHSCLARTSGPESHWRPQP
eukprot:2665766-Pyramimonas_sp.AAC.1